MTRYPQPVISRPGPRIILAPRRRPPIVLRCDCGHNLTRAGWRSCVRVGLQCDTRWHSLDLRNCPCCATTLAMPCGSRLRDVVVMVAIGLAAGAAWALVSWWGLS